MALFGFSDEIYVLAEQINRLLTKQINRFFYVHIVYSVSVTLMYWCKINLAPLP